MGVTSIFVVSFETISVSPASGLPSCIFAESASSSSSVDFFLSFDFFFFSLFSPLGSSGDDVGITSLLVVSFFDTTAVSSAVGLSFSVTGLSGTTGSKPVFSVVGSSGVGGISVFLASSSRDSPWSIGVVSVCVTLSSPSISLFGEITFASSCVGVSCTLGIISVFPAAILSGSVFVASLTDLSNFFEL